MPTTLDTGEAVQESAGVARDGFRPTTVGRLVGGLALIGLVIGGWLALTLWLAVLAPPSLSNVMPAAVAVSAAWAILLFLARRAAWWRELALRYAISTVGFSACYLLLASYFLDPMVDDIFLGLLFLLVVFGAALIAFVGGLIRIHAHRLDAVVALLSVLLFVLLLRADHTSWYDLGRRVRVSLVAERYEADARAVVANPPPPGQPTGDRIFFPAKSGSGGVVGWIWVHGIPAKAAGIAYDPYGLGRDGVVGAGEYDYGGYPCRHIDGPWYWCRFT